MRHHWIRTLLCVVVVALLSATRISAQTTAEMIQNAPWIVREVGKGVVVKTCHFDNLFGGQQDVYVADADRNTAGVALKLVGVGDGTRKTIINWAADVPGAAAAINGAWCNPSTGIPDQFLRISGVNLAYTNPVAQERGGITIAPNGTVACRTRPTNGWPSLTHPNIMASEVASVDNGLPFVWTVAAPGEGDYNYYHVNRAPRSAIGVTANNHVLLVVVDGRRAPAAIGVTYAHMAELLIALGAVNGTELDGGGSSALWGRDYGVFNQPSDGSPRSVGNALCIVADEVVAPYKADFVDATYESLMNYGSSQTVTMRFRNTGSRAWDETTFLGTTEPRDRLSVFQSPDWTSAARPCRSDPVNVAPGEIGQFRFSVVAPTLDSAATLTESFGLVQELVTWFGPENNQLKITVIPTTGTITDELIIESRFPGKNHPYYSETGAWGDSGADCATTGTTPGIGMRYGSTYRSVAGLKVAIFRPVLGLSGLYEVSVAWGPGGNRRNPITHTVVDADGLTTYALDQSATANEWVSLGRHRFEAGSGGHVAVSNENIDTAGSMYTGAVRFTYLPKQYSLIWAVR